MKVFKDKIAEWLDARIAEEKSKTYNSHAHMRYDVLVEVKSNIERIIKEEAKKIGEHKSA